MLEFKSHRGWRVWHKPDMLKAVASYPSSFNLKDPAKIPQFPQYLYWPQPGDYEGANALIDAVCDGDRRAIRSIIEPFSGFTTGAEEYLAALITRAEGGVALHPVAARKTPLFKKSLLTKQIADKIQLKVSLIAYPDDTFTSGIQCLVGKSVLTEAEASLDLKSVRILGHFPGKWRGWGYSAVDIRKLFLVTPPLNSLKSIIKAPGTLVAPADEVAGGQNKGILAPHAREPVLH